MNKYAPLRFMWAGETGQARTYARDQIRQAIYHLTIDTFTLGFITGATTFYLVRRHRG